MIKAQVKKFFIGDTVGTFGAVLMYQVSALTLEKGLPDRHSPNVIACAMAGAFLYLLAISGIEIHQRSLAFSGGIWVYIVRAIHKFVKREIR